jgi:PAS domain S-box-containing protein
MDEPCRAETKWMRPQTPAPDDPAAVEHAWRRLRFALGAAGIGTWHLDLETLVGTWDESLNRILGLEACETHVPLDEHLARIHPDDRPQVRATIARAADSRAEFSTECRVVRPDGTVRWVRNRGRIVVDEDGKPVAATGALMDITDQRRLEDRERMLAEATHALVSMVDPEKTLQALTGLLAPAFAAGCAVYLREGDAVRTAASCGHFEASPDQEAAEAVRAGIEVLEPHLLVLPLRAGGSPFGAIVFGSRAHALDPADVAFGTELADRVALSLDRARLFRDFERANRVKDEFLATLSHELRTPLNAVLGWTRMLRRGTVPPERAPSVLETIERNAAAQMQLVEELLDLSAMAAGAFRLNVTRVDLRDVIGGAVETVRPAADAKTLRVTLTIGSRISEIAGDPARLRQVIWNLLANAVKFTPAGGAVEIGVVEGPADVEITVRDTGPGIAPDFLPRMFEPFEQADSSAARTVGGLGLGLAIVRHIVEAHGGTVSAQSEGPGLGSTFCVRLPTGRPPQHGYAATRDGGLRGSRVLAVDDDESTQELVATMLLMYGVSVRTAGRATQALQIISEWRPDVLLTDIAMPGEDGYALMRRVRALPPPLGSIPAVALTAYTDPQSVQNAFAAGFDAHLGKPLEPHVLADALSKVMRPRRPR